MQANQFEVGVLADALDHLGADVAGGHLEDAHGSVHGSATFRHWVAGAGEELDFSSAALPPRPSG